MKKILGLLCLLLTSYLASSQEYIQVSGSISAPDGSPVPAAIITLDDTLNFISNTQGRFNIPKITRGRHKVTCRHTGFKVFEKQLNLDPDFKLNISLDYHQLNEVVIQEDANADNLQKLSSKNLTSVPNATGDFIQRVLGAQAGVAINNELSASYSVRGGSYDENLIYVNGIQVYRPFLVRAGQQEGLSFVNPAMVENVRFSAGGYTARYGDKMSSVLDVKYRKPTQFEGEAVLGLMGGNLAIGNQSENGKWSYIGGIRMRSNALLLGTQETKGEYQPRFWDAQVYVTHHLNSKNDISLLNVFSSNRFTFVPQTRSTEFGGFTAALRFTVFFDGQEQSQQNANTTSLQWTHRFSNKQKLELTLSNYYTYQQENFDVVGQYRLDETNRDFGSDDFGDVVRNLGVGGFLNHARNYIEAEVQSLSANYFHEIGLHTFRVGTTISTESFNEKWKEYQYIDSADFSLPRSADGVMVFESIRARNTMQTTRVQAFIEDEYNIRDANEGLWSINLGARGQFHEYTDQLFGGPRASISYSPKVLRKINDSTTVNREVVFRLAGGTYYQAPFYRELRGLQGQLNPNLRAQKATHLVLGAEYALLLWGRPFKLIGEAYHKWYQDLIPYELENVRLRYYGNNLADGFARGMDFKLHGEFIPGLESWFSIGLLSTQEDIANDRVVEYLNQSGEVIRSFTFDKEVADSNVFNPGYIPRPSDQRLRVGLYLQDEMPGFEDLTVQLNVLFGTGLPYGPPDFSRYKDTLRTTSYRRVDVGFNKEFIKPGKKYKGLLSHLKSLTLSVEILNVLDAQNIVNNTWIRDVNGTQFAIPNYLTRRLFNIRMNARF